MKKMTRLYGFDNCPYCNELKGLFDEGGIEYLYIDINEDKHDKECQKVFKLAQTDSVPIVLVNKRILSPEISFNTIQEAFELTKKFLEE
jgi:glutaredoxin